MRVKHTVYCDRDGWVWRVEEQQFCEDGVDLVYEDETDHPKETRTCLGSLDDAQALAEAILTYVKIAREAL